MPCGRVETGGTADDLPGTPGPSGDPLNPSADGLRVQADEDNCAVIQSAQDALKLIRNKFLPAVCTWVQVRRVGRARRAGGTWGDLACQVTGPVAGSSSPVQGHTMGI